VSNIELSEMRASKTPTFYLNYACHCASIRWEQCRKFRHDSYKLPIAIAALECRYHYPTPSSYCGQHIKTCRSANMEPPVDMRQYHRRESMIHNRWEKSKHLEMRTLPALYRTFRLRQHTPRPTTMTCARAKQYHF
jgi:hypothetical protein